MRLSGCIMVKSNLHSTDKHIKERKVVFLILASKNPINVIDEAYQRKTWAKSSSPGIECIWLNGSENLKSPLFIRAEQRLIVPIEDSQENILQKTILGIEWLLQNRKFDILIRTNVSSYFAIDRLKFSRPLILNEPIAAGYLDVARIGNVVNTNQLFISGSGIFMNNVAAQLLCKIKASNFIGIPDDVAISMYLLQFRIPIFSISRGNIHSTGLFKAIPYQRLKSSIHANVTQERMELVHNFFCARSFKESVKSLAYIYLFEIQYLFRSPERREELSKNFLASLKNVARNLRYRWKHYAYKN